MNKLKVETGERDITMSRRFEAPKDLVFEAYSSCEHLNHWWGPRTWPLAHCEIDFRPGGTWHYMMKGPDGTEAWGIVTYQEIQRPDRLVYVDAFSDAEKNKYPPEGVVTATFEDAEDGGSMLTWHTLYPTAEDVQKVIEMGVEAGAGETLDRLEEYLATMGD